MIIVYAIASVASVAVPIAPLATALSVEWRS